MWPKGEAWLAYCLSWLAGAGGLAGMGGRCRGGGVLGCGQARVKAGAAALPCCVSRETPTARARGSGGDYTGLCRATDQGAALPRQDRWRGRALPRQRSAVMVAATSGLYGVAVHGAAQAFARVREIDAVKNISLKKTDSVRFKIILKNG